MTRRAWKVVSKVSNDVVKSWRHGDDQAAAQENAGGRPGGEAQPKISTICYGWGKCSFTSTLLQFGVKKHLRSSPSVLCVVNLGYRSQILGVPTVTQAALKKVDSNFKIIETRGCCHDAHL